LEFGVLVFEEGGKLDNPERNRTWTTFLDGKHSHPRIMTVCKPKLKVEKRIKSAI